MVSSCCCCCASKLDFKMKKDGNTVGNKADAVFTCKSNYSDLFRGHTKSEQLQEREIPLFSAAQAGRIDACDEEPCSLWEQGAQALHQGATAPFLSCSASLCWRKIHSCINSALVRPEEERQRSFCKHGWLPHAPISNQEFKIYQRSCRVEGNLALSSLTRSSRLLLGYTLLLYLFHCSLLPGNKALYNTQV